MNQKTAVNEDPVFESSKLEKPKSVSNSAGQLLREAREAQGVDIGLLASMLKVSNNKIESLEAGQYDKLPDLAFARNLAISISRRLGINEKSVLSLMPSLGSQAASENALNLSMTPKKAMMSGGPVGHHKKRSGFWWIIILVLLAVLAVLSFMPGKWFAGSASSHNEGVQADGQRGISVPIVAPRSTAGMSTQNIPVAIDVTPVQVGNTQPSFNQTQTSVTTSAVIASQDSQAEVSQTGSNTSNPSNVDAQNNTETDPLSAVTPQTTTPEPVQVAHESVENATMQFQASTASWLEVTAVTGKRLVYRTLKAGETLELSLKDSPLSVRLVHPNAVNVTVRGRSFNLKPHLTRNGEAKFEVR